MGMKHIAQIAAALRDAGRPASEPARRRHHGHHWRTSRCWRPRLARIEADIAAAGLEPPAIICIGRSVLMRQVLDWQSHGRRQRPRATSTRWAADGPPKAHDATASCL